MQWGMDLSRKQSSTRPVLSLLHSEQLERAGVAPAFRDEEPRFLFMGAATPWVKRWRVGVAIEHLSLPQPTRAPLLEPKLLLDCCGGPWCLNLQSPLFLQVCPVR